MSLRDLDIDIDLDVDSGELERVNQQIDNLIARIRTIGDVNIDADFNGNEALAEVTELREQLRRMRDEEVEVDVEADFNRTIQELALLSEQIKTLDDDDVFIDTDIKGSRAEILELRSQLKMLERQARDLDVNLDASEAFEELKELQTYLKSIKEPKINVETDFNQTIAEMASLEERINSLDRDDIFVDVDLRASTSEILRMRQHLRVLEAQASHIDVDVDTAGAHAQLALLQAHINGIRGPSIGGSGVLGTVGNMMSGMATLDLAGMAIKGAAVLALLPAIATLAQVALGVVGTLGVAIGVVAGGLLGLASAVGVASLGLVGFGAIAISAITDLYDENAQLTSSQLALKKQTDSVVDSWNELKTTLQPFSFHVITGGVGVINSLLNTSEPIIKKASLAVGGLFDSLNQSLKSDDMKGFFSYMERAVMPLTENIGNGLGYAIRGVLNTMTALEPLTSWVAQGFENMMSGFSDWTSGLVGSEGMKKFMDYTKENLPKIGDAIGDMSLGIVDFFAAFGGTASDGLTWFAEKMEDFSEWSSDLGENKGFQNMLDNIAEDGPKIAETIGNITTNIIDLTTALSNVGKDENGEGGLWSLLRDFSNPENFNSDGLADMFSWKTLISPPWALWENKPIDFDKMFDISGKISTMKEKFETMRVDTSNWFGEKKIKISDWFSDVKINISDWFSGKKIKLNDMLGDFNFKWPSIPKTDFKWPSLPKFSWPSLPKFNFKWPSLPKFSFKWPSLPKFSWPSMPKINWPSLPKMNWPSLPKFNFPSLPKFSFPSLPKFSFPSLPKFSWPSMPKFSWPSLPKFSWPSFPKFSWPSFPKFSWPSMPKLSIPGFSSGLGRVPQDMNATIHKGEAVIQADNAQKLRDSGILSGDGRHPTINTNAVSTTSVSTSSVAPSTVATNNGGNTYSMPITVTVQGGNTNAETGSAVASAIESMFANMRDVFPAMREG